MKRGFTLIELAVAVAIVVILAAILIPVFQRPHRGMSRRSSCLGNLKLLGLGMSNYVQDYDGFYPATTGSRATGWANAVEPYVVAGREPFQFQCPSEQTPQPILGAGKTLYTDYWMNKRLVGFKTKKNVRPALTLLFGDGNEGAASSYVYNAIDSLPLEWLSDERGPLYRHIVGANFAFADGHVKFLQARKVTSASCPAGFRFAPE